MDLDGLQLKLAGFALRHTRCSELHYPLVRAHSPGEVFNRDFFCVGGGILVAMLIANATPPATSFVPPSSPSLNLTILQFMRTRSLTIRGVYSGYVSPALQGGWMDGLWVQGVQPEGLGQACIPFTCVGKHSECFILDAPCSVRKAQNVKCHAWRGQRNACCVVFEGGGGKAGRMMSKEW